MMESVRAKTLRLTGFWANAFSEVVRVWTIPPVAIGATAALGVVLFLAGWRNLAIVGCLTFVVVGLIQHVLRARWIAKRTRDGGTELGLEFFVGGVAYDLGGRRHWLSWAAHSGGRVEGDRITLPGLGLLPECLLAPDDFACADDFDAAARWMKAGLNARDRVPWAPRAPDELPKGQRAGAYELALRVWDDLFWPPTHPWADRLGEAFSELGGPDGPWLDVGCGGGRLLSQAEGPWAARVGLEADAGLAARARAAVAGRPSSAIFHADQMDALPAGGFAFVTASSLTIHHLISGSDPVTLFAAIAARLLPGGLFLFDFLVTGSLDVDHTFALGVVGPPAWVRFQVDHATGRMRQYLDLGDAWELAEGRTLKMAQVEEAAWAANLEVALVASFGPDRPPVPVLPGTILVLLRRPLDA